jgi:hypothetical protein
MLKREGTKTTDVIWSVGTAVEGMLENDEGLTKESK